MRYSLSLMKLPVAEIFSVKLNKLSDPHNGKSRMSKKGFYRQLSCTDSSSVFKCLSTDT